MGPVMAFVMVMVLMLGLEVTVWADEDDDEKAEMRKALQEIIRLVEGWVDSDERKAEATMLKILNTALKVV